MVVRVPAKLSLLPSVSEEKIDCLLKSNEPVQELSGRSVKNSTAHSEDGAGCLGAIKGASAM
ncbi:hypothetical protein [Corallococcus sp. EGB]|uniref:hypothetical protein n=1 Tax=Corallococcus sp. EGB TaxID=1521117 RepID=UPI001CBAF005|nr:hypothetical protein [Corallococcus sp. EGB]